MRVQGKLMNDQQVKERMRMASNRALFGKIVCGECGTRYKRYSGKKNIWRCETRILKHNACDGRSITEKEVLSAIVDAFNMLPLKRDDLIRMQERIIWGPLDRISREIDEIDKRKTELEDIISNYAETGRLDPQLVFTYRDEESPTDDGDENDSDTNDSDTNDSDTNDGDTNGRGAKVATEETIVDSISAEIADLNEKRNALLCQKGDLGIQEANIQTLLKLTNAIMKKSLTDGQNGYLSSSKQTVRSDADIDSDKKGYTAKRPIAANKPGDDRKIRMAGKNTASKGSAEAPEVKSDPACYDLADFYARTDRITQCGPLKKYDDILMKRFVGKVVVKKCGLEVIFKAGISIEV